MILIFKGHFFYYPKEFEGVIIWVVFITGFVILVGIIIVSLAVVKSPLSSLGESTLELSTGEMNLSFRLKVRHNDELSRISQIFNNFLERLHEIIGNISSESQEITKAVDVMKNTARELTGAVNSITQHISLVQMQSNDR